MRIEVMPERCIGSGNCVDVAPRYFDQSDLDGVVEVLESDVATADEPAVAEAADICPVAAILLGVSSPAAG
ncbi:MAG TPA: ferredoxin [Streptosporangiaceae bacterium]|jgi:ferredoxin|nr:ferredoxin [Streptosporangiaceae bacterium]